MGSFVAVIVDLGLRLQQTDGADRKNPFVFHNLIALI
jgi:hypothetical protein